MGSFLHAAHITLTPTLYGQGLNSSSLKLIAETFGHLLRVISSPMGLRAGLAKSISEVSQFEGLPFLFLEAHSCMPASINAIQELHGAFGGNIWSDNYRGQECKQNRAATQGESMPVNLLGISKAVPHLSWKFKAERTFVYDE